MKEKACKISRDPKYDEYQRTLASMVCKFFHKKTGDWNQWLKNLKEDEPMWDLKIIFGQ